MEFIIKNDNISNPNILVELANATKFSNNAANFIKENFDIIPEHHLSCIAQSLKPLNKNLILIKASNNRTYENRKFGFILDVDQANISEAYYSNTGSGYGEI